MKNAALLTKPNLDSPRENNKLRIEDTAAHDWYRFVLSFPPHLVRIYLERFGLGSEDTVLDPFCGTGTTLVECKKNAIPSIGIERNPMAHFASQTKTDWSGDPNGLVKHAREIALATADKLDAEGISNTNGLPLFNDQRNVATTLRTLPRHVEKLLLRESISPLPLHKTLMLLETMKELADSRFEKYERLALAKSIVFDASNLHFGPEVGIGTMKSDAPVLESWLRYVRKIADDLEVLHSKNKTRAIACCADARNLTEIIMPGSIAGVITSPPYPNEKDYTRTTRLESVMLGFLLNKDELRQIKKELVRSNTRSVYKEDDDDKWVAGYEAITRIADTIERRRIQLQKTSGFERMYARVTKLYFGGIAKHLSNLRTVLKPAAQLAYVVGDQASYLRVMIRTGQILADIAESLGYKVKGIDLFRTRLATATREQLREEVVLLQWPGGDPKRRRTL